MDEIGFDVSPALREWIHRRVADGQYASVHEYVCDLVRRDRDAARNETEWLREQIRLGRESGVIKKDARAVLRDIIAERPAKRA